MLPLLWAAAPMQRARAEPAAAVADTAALLQTAAARLMAAGPTAPFDVPLSLRSSASATAVSAELDAVIAQPFAQVRQALSDPQQWCSVLLLHINNKACRAPAAQALLSLKVARKYDQPVENAYDLEFVYRNVESSARLLSTRLSAASGPMGTSDYAIRLDAAPLDDGHTVLRLAYAYNQNALTGLAMDLYFATIGSGKVGFTTKPAVAGAPVEYVGGVRGLVERNLLRYLYAIEAGAGTPDAVTADAFERRLRAWFAATQRHPRQLHEIDLDTYLALKRPLGPVPTASAR